MSDYKLTMHDAPTTPTAWRRLQAEHGRAWADFARESRAIKDSQLAADVARQSTLRERARFHDAMAKGYGALVDGFPALALPHFRDASVRIHVVPILIGRFAKRMLRRVERQVAEDARARARPIETTPAARVHEEIEREEEARELAREESRAVNEKRAADSALVAAARVVDDAPTPDAARSARLDLAVLALAPFTDDEPKG